MGFLEMNDGWTVDDNSIQRVFKRNYIVICYAYPMLCSEEPVSLDSMDSLESVDVRRLHPSQHELVVKFQGGTSVMNFIHMSQFYRSGKFRDFDYGYAGNY